MPWYLSPALCRLGVPQGERLCFRQYHVYRQPAQWYGNLCAYGKTKDKKILRKSGYYFGIIFLFAVGAALGGHMIGYIGAKTIWISCTILLISFFMHVHQGRKEEHPEIMEEEQEIRDNLKNIRKEARDVEHIPEDDIRSQIEKNNVKTGEKDRNPTENLGILLKYNPVSKVAIFGFTNPVFGVLLSAHGGWERVPQNWAGMH